MLELLVVLCIFVETQTQILFAVPTKLTLTVSLKTCELLSGIVDLSSLISISR